MCPTLGAPTRFSVRAGVHLFISIIVTSVCATARAARPTAGRRAGAGAAGSTRRPAGHLDEYVPVRFPRRAHHVSREAHCGEVRVQK